MIRNNQRRPGAIRTPHKNRPRRDNLQNQENEIWQQSQWHSNQLYQKHSNQSNNYSYAQSIQLSQSEVYPSLQNSNALNSTSKCREQINLQNAQLEDVQAELSIYPHLELVLVLNLSRNTLRTLPSSLLPKMPNLTHLHLHSNSLDKFSFPYFSQHRLATLDLSCNNLTSLNLQHVDSLQELNCSRNALALMTLPKGLKVLDAAGNRLSNVYAIQQCERLEVLMVGGNLLYDLKLVFRRNAPQSDKVTFPFLSVLDCSNNKIQHLEGLSNAPNLHSLNLSNNRLTITRDALSELVSLTHLHFLTVKDNHIQEAGFSQDEIYHILATRISCLEKINGIQVDELVENYEERRQSGRKSEFSGIMEEPYQIFMEEKDKNLPQEVMRNIEWNFTLGDCQNQQQQNASEEKINDLSLIQQVGQIERLDYMASHQDISQHIYRQEYPSKKTSFNHSPPIKQTFQQNSSIPQNHQTKQQFDPTIPQAPQKQLKLKLVRSVTSSLSLPHHIHYHPFLKALLPMSYIPAHPILLNAPKTTARRLDHSDDDYLLIAKMFSNRGGVVYIKKINVYAIHQNNAEVWPRYGGKGDSPHMAFLLNEINQKQFREMCRYSKLVGRNARDVVGMQPNVFSCYHAIVRVNPYREGEEEYGCAYLVQSAHL